MPEQFTRFFVYSASGDVEEIYDGDEDGNRSIALEAVAQFPGGYVEELVYTLTSSRRIVAEDE
jgi:hypothetical protein